MSKNCRSLSYFGAYYHSAGKSLFFRYTLQRTGWTEYSWYTCCIFSNYNWFSFLCNYFSVIRFCKNRILLFYRCFSAVFPAKTRPHIHFKFCISITLLHLPNCSASRRRSIWYQIPDYWNLILNIPLSLLEGNTRDHYRNSRKMLYMRT